MRSDWNYIPLGELVEFTSGGTPSKKNPRYWNGDIPWISAKTLKSEQIYTSDLFITKEGLENASRLAPVGSILLLVRGSGLFNGIPIGRVSETVAFNQDIKCINSCTDVENEYIFYWLISQRSYLMAKVGSTGIGAGKFDMDFLQKLNVPIPPKQERYRIISIVRSISQRIDLNKKVNNNLEQQALAIFEQKFVADQASKSRQAVALYDLAEYINGTSFKKDEYSDSGMPIAGVKFL